LFDLIVRVDGSMP